MLKTKMEVTMHSKPRASKRKPRKPKEIPEMQRLVEAFHAAVEAYTKKGVKDAQSHVISALQRPQKRQSKKVSRHRVRFE